MTPTDPTISAEERAAIKAVHFERTSSVSWCFGCHETWPCVPIRVLAALDAKDAEIAALAQATWDARSILGFDNDGDPTPAACLTQGVEPYIEGFLSDMREARRDYDAALAEGGQA